MRIITKSSDEREAFNPGKFKRSLHKSGADDKVIEKLLDEILSHTELITTQAIYDYAYHRLKEINTPLAARYSLKNALYELGPEGFLFERFMGILFKARGYTTQNDVTLSGFCVDHEIDILMEKDGKRFIAECKFHNRRGLKTDVKVALYVKARFLDLEAQKSAKKAPDGVWLLTNTQLTSEAIKYGVCSGINMLGWSYPEEGSIAQLIDSLGLHPITSLTGLTTSQKKMLLGQNIILSHDVLKHPEALHTIGLSSSEAQHVAQEAHILSAKHPHS